MRLRMMQWVMVAALAAGSMHGAGQSLGPILHTYPLNLDPVVRDGYQHFYNLDYDIALSRFQQVLKAHPNDPMAVNYVLLGTLFRELYHQDLLDTTYYAHEHILTSKRATVFPASARQQIESLTAQAIALSDQRINANPNDKDAWFARGYAQGLHATFLVLADHSFVSAANQGRKSRNDHEHVLQLDRAYTDAEMAVGIQQFVIATMPRALRMLAGIAGFSGSKEKGLAMLRDAAEHGTVTSVESRIALSLFLRHDARYQDAVMVQKQLSGQYPHNFLFRVEVANLTKDEGNGPQAIALYKAVLADAEKKNYFIDARLQMAWFGLADTERGQNDFDGAAHAYLQAAAQLNCSEWMRKRAELFAGEMLDLLHLRDQALQQYQLAASPGIDQSQAEEARKYMKTPYPGK